VEALQPGEGVYSFFLNAQGRVLSDAVILCGHDHLLVCTEPTLREVVFSHIDHYIIADDVTLEDLTARTCEFAVEGPEAGERLVALGAPMPSTEYGVAKWRDVTVARVSATGALGFRLIAPLRLREDLKSRLAQALPQASLEDRLTVRLEHGKPRFGIDMNERYIAHETGQLQALNFQKGCYLGQEVVERVRSRGQVHRHLTPIAIMGQEVPNRGDKIFDAQREAGEITSAALSPATGVVRALAYLRGEARNSRVLHTAEGYPVKVVQD
jgi:aminomethyltransferase